MNSLVSLFLQAAVRESIPENLPYTQAVLTHALILPHSHSYVLQGYWYGYLPSLVAASHSPSVPASWSASLFLPHETAVDCPTESQIASHESVTPNSVQAWGRRPRIAC